jgi:hypothetical protein
MGDWIMRNLLTAAAAVLAIGGAAIATGASAHPGPHGGFGPHPIAYGHGGYWGHPVGGFYFAPPPAFFIGADYYGFYDGCHSHWRWDPYAGRYVDVTACY